MVFKVPPEVPNFFAQKNLKVGFSWLDVWAEEHARSFTVAKAVELDLLQAFKTSLQKAIEGGQSFETWREHLKPELEKLGWWGKRTVQDPTGAYKPKQVDFSSPQRLQTIFWSNMRSARAAGQWERIQRSKRGLPYLVYVHTASARARPLHLSWVGTILPADDPFWNTHFPPNGWNCKCSVRQVTGSERDDLLTQNGYSSDVPPQETKAFINKRTGEISQVPNGIDAGWQTNPGKARSETLLKSLEDKLQVSGAQQARASIKSLWSSNYSQVLKNLPQTIRVRAPAAVSESLQTSFETTTPIISISNDTLRIKDQKHGGDMARIQQIIDEGAVIDKSERGRKEYWAVAYIDKQLWKVAVKQSEAGFMYIATYHRIRANEVKSVVIPDLQSLTEISTDE